MFTKGLSRFQSKFLHPFLSFISTAFFPIRKKNSFFADIKICFYLFLRLIKSFLDARKNELNKEKEISFAIVTGNSIVVFPLEIPNLFFDRNILENLIPF